MRASILEPNHRSSLWILGIHGFFFLVFCSISLLNHFYFRTFGLDYGIANQALYQYAHFKPAVCTQLLGGTPMPYLGLHLSLWVPILSPFYWIFGSYTLLLFQNFAILFCGFGIQKLAYNIIGSNKICGLILLQFYAGFAIYSAIAFDFHDNVIGACFLPWLFYYFQRGALWPMVLCFLAILISKENLSIWLCFIALPLIFTKGKNHTRIKVALFVLILVSIGWFLMASSWLMPMLNPTGNFDQLSRFSHLGSNLFEIIEYIFQHPLKMVTLFFKSNIQPDADEAVKQEFLWAVLLSGGLVLILKPKFLWMALPILMQKLWNKELAFWGVSYHYQIELAPIISIAWVYFLQNTNTQIWKKYLLELMVIATCFTTINLMQHRLADYKPEKENIFSKAHFQQPFDCISVQTKLKEIPGDAIVCAQSNLMPHLAFREKLYHFPFIKNAEYLVVLQPQLNAYPLRHDLANAWLDSIRTTANWQEDSTVFPLRILKLRKIDSTKN